MKLTSKFAILPVLAVILGLLLIGCLPATSGIDPNSSGGGGVSETFKLFQQVWDHFDQNYSHFFEKFADWDDIYVAYSPTFEPELSTTAFVNALAPMLAELEDLHVSLFDPQGDVVETYSRPAVRNWLGGYLPKYFPHGVSRLQGTYPLRHGWLDAGKTIAYMSIESFDGSAWDGLRTSELNGLFATYAGAYGMVVDIRQNSGGAENIAKAIAGYFTDQDVVYGYTTDRIPGDDRYAFAAADEHELEAADPQYQYLEWTVLLMGNKNMSSAEWFILMMDLCPYVWIMGDDSRGSSGNPKEFGLSNGVTYLIPSWAAYDSDGFDIEDFGLAPYDWVDPDLSYDDALERDYLLEDAVDWLTSP